MPQFNIETIHANAVWRTVFFAFLFVAFLTGFTTQLIAESTGSRGAILVETRPGYSPAMDPLLEYNLQKLGFAVNEINHYDVSLEKLKNFNVVIVEWTPHQSELLTQSVQWQQTVDTLHKYIKQGGSVLFIDSEPTIGETQGTAEAYFFDGLGLTPLGEGVCSDNTIFRQKAYLLYYFARTTDIAKHPVTEGISELIYPCGHSPEAGATRTMQVDENWTVLLRGGRSTSTYKEGAPILAVREYGKGRIMYLPIKTPYLISAPYHQIYDRLVIEKGNFFNLLVNALDWLAEPSLKSGAFGGYSEEVTPVVTKEDPFYNEPPIPPQPERSYTPVLKKSLKGIIGVRSTLSDGKATVAEYCTLAKELGYDFLVFTESFEYMNPQKWSKLVSECAANSDETFLAVAGLEYGDGFPTNRGNRRVAFFLKKWPDKTWLTTDGKGIANQPGFMFGPDYPMIAIVQPTINPGNAWTEKFYHAFSLFNYDCEGNLYDDSLATFLYINGNQHDSIPMTYHVIKDLDGLKSVSGYATRVWANTPGEIPSVFKYSWYGRQNTYVSNGPRIDDFTMVDGWGSYRQWKWQLHIDVSSDAGLQEIILHDGAHPEPYRRFDVEGNRFTTTLTGYHDKQRFFIMEVIDSEGKRAISPCAFIGDSRHSMYMCIDMQNTIEGGYAERKSGKKEFMVVMGLAVTGFFLQNPGILVPPDELFPYGIDYAVKGFSGGVSFGVFGKEGIEYTHRYRPKFHFASGDVTILDFISEGYMKPYPSTDVRTYPTRFADNHMRVYAWTPRMYSYNILHMTNDVTFKQDITLIEGTNRALPYYAATAGGDIESFPNYVYINADGEKIDKRRTHTDYTIYVDKEVIPKGGYAGMYPDFYGSFALYPLDGPYDVRYDAAHVQLGISDVGRIIRKGTEFNHEFLLVRGKFGEESSEGFDMIRDIYGLDGTPAYTVTVDKGKLLNTQFVLSVEAENFSSQFQLGEAALPNDLPIIVSNLNDNWDAAMIDGNTGELRRVGVEDGVGYVTIDTSKPHNIWIGNLVRIDNLAIRANVLEYDDRYVIDLNNPLDTDTWVTIETPEELSPLYKYNEKFLFEAGSRREITIPKNK